MDASGPTDPVKAKVYLLDSSSGEVIWMNEAAAEGASSPEVAP